MSNHFRLSLATTEATAPVIAVLRRHTGKSISELRRVITSQQPILDETPHHNQYAAFLESMIMLLDSLEAESIPYGLEIDGLPENRQFLNNILQQWHDIGESIMYMSDLESGVPSIETVEWLMNQ
jgi:hypothetical protein